MSLLLCLRRPGKPEETQHTVNHGADQAHGAAGDLCHPAVVGQDTNVPNLIGVSFVFFLFFLFW